MVTSTAAYNLAPSLINYSFPRAVSIKFSDSDKVLTNDGGTACGGTMALMLPQSCDPGYGQLGVELGVPTLTKQAQDFGYSIYEAATQYVPNLDLPNVIPSTFSELSPNSQAFLAYSAIGQYNDAATPLQNALVAAGIANGGVIMTPHLMEQIRDSQGNVVTTYKPTPMLTVSTPGRGRIGGQADAERGQRHCPGRHGERDLPGLVARGGQDGHGPGPGAHRARSRPTTG